MSRLPAMRCLAPRAFPSILLVCVGVVFSVVTCVDEDSRKSVSMNGTVVFVPLEGGFYGITAEDGRKWDPENLSDEFAIDGLPVSFRGVPQSHPTFHMWGQPIRLVSVKRTGDPPKVDLEPFRELARNASCADLRNRLFLIDDYLVFWDREARCSDAGYARHLYGRTPDHVMCFSEDSIAGPREACQDRERYRTLFELILAHLDQPDLGLGPAHTVVPVDF